MREPDDLSLRSRPVRMAWVEQMFTAKAAARGGVVRRAVRDVEREVGRDLFMDEVDRRGYHLIECGGQFVVICSDRPMRVLL
jgi:hypothetical protein